MTKQERSIQEKALILLIHTSRVVNKYYSTFLNKNVGLSISQVAVLTVLDENGGSMNPSAIASATYTERNNITTLVTRMKKLGLVEAKRDPKDKRLVKVIITDKGREVFYKAKPIILEYANKVILALSEDNAILLDRPLRILRQNAQDGLSELSEPSRECDDY